MEYCGPKILNKIEKIIKPRRSTKGYRKLKEQLKGGEEDNERGEIHAISGLFEFYRKL